MSVHSWCLNPSRDEAVRAAEDGRPGPLPTLEEAISAVTERRPVDAGGGGNVTGLRTERVTLEVTHFGPESVAGWEWEYHIRPRHIFESVRVVEEFGTALPNVVEDMAAEINRLDSERDAAIREREELRSQVQILDEGQPTAPSDLGVWCTAKDLSARCKELAARLVTTAVRASSAETALREIFAQDYTRSAVNGASWKMHDIAEKALQSTPAASGAAGTEPVAWAILRGGHFIVATVNEAAANESCKDYGGTVVPLYAAPQPATGWLTAEERGSIWYAIEGLREAASRRNNGHARTLESLLDRSSPPEVVRPPYKAGHSMRDGEWIEALAAAGVKVKEVG